MSCPTLSSRAFCQSLNIIMYVRSLAPNEVKKCWRRICECLVLIHYWWYVEVKGLCLPFHCLCTAGWHWGWVLPSSLLSWCKHLSTSQSATQKTTNSTSQQQPHLNTVYSLYITLFPELERHIFPSNSFADPAVQEYGMREWCPLRWE